MMDPVYTYSVPIKQVASGSFDILSHIMETYFSEPDEDNIFDDISEALMRSVIRNLRTALKDPEDYTARSNLMWASTMGENRIIKLGKKMDFECHQIEHQLGAYTDCNHVSILEYGTWRKTRRCQKRSGRYADHAHIRAQYGFFLEMQRGGTQSRHPIL